MPWERAAVLGECARVGNGARRALGLRPRIGELFQPGRMHPKSELAFYGSIMLSVPKACQLAELSLQIGGLLQHKERALFEVAELSPQPKSLTQLQCCREELENLLAQGSMCAEHVPHVPLDQPPRPTRIVADVGFRDIEDMRTWQRLAAVAHALRRGILVEVLVHM